MSFLTIAPIDTSLGNFISFNGWPIIGEVSNASTDITSPNSSIIEWTASTCPFLMNCKIDETVITGGLTTASISKELTKGKNAGWFIRATVWVDPDLLASNEDNILTSSWFVAAMYELPATLASFIIEGSNVSPEIIEANSSCSAANLAISLSSSI